MIPLYFETPAAAENSRSGESGTHGGWRESEGVASHVFLPADRVARRTRTPKPFIVNAKYANNNRRF